jgi:hypothetical protein
VVDRLVTSIDSGQSLVPSLKEGVYSQLLMDLTHKSHQQQSWLNVPNIDEFIAL